MLNYNERGSPSGTLIVTLLSLFADLLEACLIIDLEVTVCKFS